MVDVGSPLNENPRDRAPEQDPETPAAPPLSGVYVSPFPQLPGRLLPGLWLSDTLDDASDDAAEVAVFRLEALDFAATPLVDAFTDFLLTSPAPGPGRLLAVHSSGTAFDVIATSDYELNAAPPSPSPAGVSPLPLPDGIGYFEMPDLLSGSRAGGRTGSHLRMFSRDLLTANASTQLLELLAAAAASPEPPCDVHPRLHPLLLGCRFIHELVSDNQGFEDSDPEKATLESDADIPIRLIADAQVDCVYTPLVSLARLYSEEGSSPEPNSGGWEFSQHSLQYELSDAISEALGKEPRDLPPVEVAGRENFIKLEARSGVDVYRALIVADLIGDVAD